MTERPLLASGGPYDDDDSVASDASVASTREALAEALLRWNPSLSTWGIERMPLPRPERRCSRCGRSSTDPDRPDIDEVD